MNIKISSTVGNIDRTQLPSYLIIILMPLIYWFFSRGYSGPVLYTDEIGYLTKAAFLGGHTIDGASKYHGGYAFFLAPLFFFFDSWKEVWAGIMFFNGLCWVGSFLVLNKLLSIWKPDISSSQRFLTLLIAAFYPTWITMTGYAFPTCLSIFIFFCCIVTLAEWRKESILSLLPHSLLVGFLFWIHPSSFGVAVASTITVGAVSITDKKYRGFMLNFIIILFLILVYKKGLEPWWNNAMTPIQYSYERYPSTLFSIKQLFNFALFIDFLKKLSGQLSYVTISSFGLTLLGAIYCIYKTGTLFTPKFETRERLLSAISLFLVLSLLWVACIGALFFTGITNGGGADHFFYGRYIDGTTLPLLAIGFLILCEGKKQKNGRLYCLIFAAIFIGYTGYSLRNLDTITDNNLAMTVSFFPQYIIKKINFLQWMEMGFIGVIIAIVFGRDAALALMMVSFLISTNAQSQWHRDKYSFSFLKPTFFPLIEANFDPNSCIGFNDSNPTFFQQNTLLHTYSFYFFNYQYTRMSVDEWRAHCNGPFLTYNPTPFIGSSTETVFARQVNPQNNAHLYLIVKNNKKMRVNDNLNPLELLISENSEDPCVLNLNCFMMTASEMSQISHIGVLRNNQWASDGKAGMLLYGPWRSIEKGTYSLILQGNFETWNTVMVEIVSDKGTKSYSKNTLGQECSECRAGKVVIPFELKKNVSDLEVRMSIEPEDRVAISNYKITPR